MAQIPFHKLRNLRSGMTVWRVFGHMDDDGNIDGLHAEEYHVMGKRVLHHHSGCDKGFGTMLMHWRRFESLSVRNRPTWMYGSRVHFLNDLHGYGCFDTRRSALRFVAEVKAGLHPAILEEMEQHRDNMNELGIATEEHDREYIFNDLDGDPDEYREEMDSPSHHNMHHDDWPAETPIGGYHYDRTVA